MSKLDRIKFNATSTGTGSFVVSTAVQGFRTPATAGTVDGTPVSYIAQSADQTQWETGESFYTVSGTLVARNPHEGSSGIGVLVNFTTIPIVGFGPLEASIRRTMVSLHAHCGGII